jgi:plasmid stabilization system protein ParE
MNYTLIVRPEAEEDLRSAYQWYQEQRKGLGDEFLLCVEVAFASILKNREQYIKIHKEVHRALLRRFPYGIFYVIDNNIISIISIFHCSRDPQRWINRVEDNS